MAFTWIKLYIEILDDPKVGLMPDWAFRRFIQFLLVARERNQGGLLGPVSELAWRLRSSEDDMLSALRTMSEIGIVRETGDGWLVVNFAKRQKAETSTQRSQESRKRNAANYATKRCKNGNEAEGKDSSSTSVSPSALDLGVGGVGEGVTVNCPALYEANFGALTSVIADELVSLEQEYSPLWLSEAMAEAVRSEARNLKYVHAILKRWKRDGFKAAKSSGKAKDMQKSMQNIQAGLDMAFGKER